MNTVKKFQKRKENFVCEYCNTKVIGNGYTNHCPHCLHSKHVDIFPGDRLEGCGGQMSVTQVQKKGDGYRITHTCHKCGAVSHDHLRDRDNMDILIEVNKKLTQNK